MSDEGDIESAAASLEKIETERISRYAAREASDFVDVLASLHGRRMVWGLIEKSGFLEIGFAGEQSHLAAFNEGRRNEGRRLWSMIEELCPDRLMQMRQEYRKQ